MTSSESGIPGESKLRGSTEQLTEFIDASLAARPEGTDHFATPMARTLADRIGLGGPVSPLVYSIGIESVIRDCTETGVDSFTGQPLPSEIVGRDAADYPVFRVLAIDLAQGAFGKAYADELRTIYRASFET